MRAKLEAFVEKVEDFEKLSSGEKIPFFIYFLSGENNRAVFPLEVKDCFLLLLFPPYSNIAAYMGRKSSGKNPVFIK